MLKVTSLQIRGKKQFETVERMICEGNISSDSPSARKFVLGDITEVYSEPCQINKTERFAKILND